MSTIALRLFFLLGIMCFSHLSARGPDASLEESLELRRIAEYWKEKDYKTAKNQIREFLNKNPKSSYDIAAASRLSPFLISG